MRALIKRIRQLLKDKRFRKFWHRGVSGTAAVVVFITTYALVLPAITMESEASCGIPAHQHTTDCYEEQLICGQEESDGHHHTDDCYTVTKELTCTTPEHQHDESCFDEDGNLTCSQAEHTHDSTCYEEHRDLTCGLEESEGHHHDSSCYKQVLTCGLEAHIHSVECYKEDSKAVTASTSIQASDEFDSAVAATAASTSVPAETYEPENASNASTAFDENSSTAELSSAAATTGVLPEPVEQEDLSEGYVPTLDPVNMDQVLDKHTGFYYYHAGEGEELPASSTEITSWKKVDDNTELAPTDLVKAYFAYTIPAGTLNETNQVARYRLPSNLHLTDDQIIAINQQENGIASQFINYDTLEITDSEKYDLYRGAEAVEGTRTPDQTLADDAQEYISAVVKAENVYDVEGLYGEKGAYLGQDLIFIFTPYTIEKNQNTYDSEGNPTSAGHKVTGWFACDFNMDQIDWVEDETDTDHDKTAIEKTADILFAAQDDVLNIKEISQTLKLVDTIEAPEDAAEDAVGETTDADEEIAEAESNSPEETEDNAATSATEDAAEMTDDSAADISATAETTESASTSDADPTYKDGTLTASGADYTITLDYTADACIPENAELKIREITKESDPEAYDACLSQAKEQVIDPSADENKTVDEKTSRFFDIEIMVPGTPDDTGKMDAPRKIEPKAPVNVNIHLTETAKAATETSDQSVQDSQDQPAQTSDPTVLHFLKDGVETIESTTAPAVSTEQENSTDSSANTEEGKQIQFEASSFSVYGVVYTSVITTTYITASGETYEITVTYGNDAEIPEGSQLFVRELEEGTEEFDNCLSDSAMELGAETNEISFARFFDIEIKKDNLKIEPKAPVTVQIKYADGINLSAGETLSVVHFAEEGTEVINDISLDEECETISYKQDSFSITGTLKSGAPQNGQTYMLVVNYEGNNYVINNDGTLTLVDTVDSDHIKADSAMLWTYYYQYGGNFRFAAEASGFDWNQVASGFYYRYLDPNSPDGLRQEDASNPHLESATQINYNSNDKRIRSTNNNNYYIGISDEGGVLHITGQANGSNAARISLYGADEIHPADPFNQTVSHIDISIVGSAKVQVPLAYGDYYYKDASGNWQNLHISAETAENIRTQHLVKNDVKISSEDMKHASIKAYKTNTDGTPDRSQELNDVFSITGYSANENTQWSTDQVRIEGSFKVADLDPISGWNPNTSAQMTARLQHKITYEVIATKQETLTLTYTDPNTGRVYDLYQSQDAPSPMTINAEIPLSAYFNYWTDIPHVGNECPPLQEGWGFTNTWRKGGIEPWGLSGMDFVLQSHEVQVQAKIAAVEITKWIQDDSGNPIKLEGSRDFNFEIYQDLPGDPNSVRINGSEIPDYTSYSKLRDSTVRVGYTNNSYHTNIPATTGRIYDYNVSDGMYYVREVDVPQTLTDDQGQEWNYKETIIKTEYVWRDNEYKQENDPATQNATHDKTVYEGDLSSIPEVVGDYKDDNNVQRRNEFLEFDFINVYSKNYTPPPTPVVDHMSLKLDKHWLDNEAQTEEDKTKAPSEGSIEFTIHQISTPGGKDVEGSGFPKKVTVYAEDDWSLTIPDLPTKRTVGANVTTYKYYLEEGNKTGDAVQRYQEVSFRDNLGADEYHLIGSEEDGATISIEVTNRTSKTMKIQKRWINIDPASAPEVHITLWQQKFQSNSTNPDGNAVAYKTYTLTNENRVEGTNWWELEIPSPPSGYGYFITEANINPNGKQLFDNPHYYVISGNTTVSDYDAFDWSNPSDWGNGTPNWTSRVDNSKTQLTEDVTLMAINTPKDAFDQVDLRKIWYIWDSSTNSVKEVSGTDAISQYAIGLQIYQYLDGDTQDQANPFGNAFYVASNTNVIDNNGSTLINEDNPFSIQFSTDGGKWRMRFIKAHGALGGFPKQGVNKNGETVYYKYFVKEIGVYTGSHAHTAEDLTRVHDFTLVSDWTFNGENQQNYSWDGNSGSIGRGGVNYPAGELDVTKKWENGEPGSKVYFKVYQGSKDITSSIISSPEDYGLSIYQVYHDDPDLNNDSDAIVVTCTNPDDPDGWETINIKNLPLAAYPDTSAVQYTIKEIGYSDASGIDYWNGDTIQYPNGTSEIFEISDLLESYQLDSGNPVSPSNDGKSPGTTLISDETHKIKINNKYEPKYKDFEVTKIWQGQTASEFLQWPADVSSITVDLYAGTESAVGNRVVEGIPLFITPPDENATRTFQWEGKTYTWDVSMDASGKVYTFKFLNLPAKLNDVEATYYVKETNAPSEYTVSYGWIKSEEKVVQGITVTERSYQNNTDAEAAGNGKVIRNMKTDEGVELPSTGGPGTRWIYILGTALTFFAVGLLWKRKPQ